MFFAGLFIYVFAV